MLGINWTKIFQPLVPLASLSVPPSCSPILVRPFYFDLLDLLCNLTSIDLPLKKVRRQLNCQDMILYWQYYSHSCVCFVIRYVTLRYVMFCYVLLCYVMLRYVTLRYVTFCYVLLCFVMFCYVTLRYVTLRYVTLRYVMLCYVIYFRRLVRSFVAHFSIVTLPAFTVLMFISISSRRFINSGISAAKRKWEINYICLKARQKKKKNQENKLH